MIPTPSALRALGWLGSLSGQALRHFQVLTEEDFRFWFAPVGFEPTTYSSKVNRSTIDLWLFLTEDVLLLMPRWLLAYKIHHTFIRFPCQVLTISGPARFRRTATVVHGNHPWLTTSDLFPLLDSNTKFALIPFTLPGGLRSFPQPRRLTSLHHPNGQIMLNE